MRIFSFPTDSRSYRFLLSVVKGLSDFEFKTLIKWKRIVKIFQLLLIPGPWLRINWVSSDNFICGSWRQEKKITNKDTKNQNNKQLNTPTDFSSKKYEKQKLISLFQIKSNLKVIKAANSFGADTDGRHATTTLRWLSAFPLVSSYISTEYKNLRGFRCRFFSTTTRIQTKGKKYFESANPLSWSPLNYGKVWKLKWINMSQKTGDWGEMQCNEIWIN